MPPQHDKWSLILGGASCVWEDVQSWEVLYGKRWDGLVIAANDIGAHWPRDLHHWVSLHPNKFKKWKALRNQQQLPDSRPETWGRDRRFGEKGLSDHALLPWHGGSSGMFAIQVARELKCTRAILCGIPMTFTPHFAQTQESFAPQWHQSAAHFKAWPRYKEHMIGWVRSMSGKTQELLGVPTLEWLLEG